MRISFSYQIMGFVAHENDCFSLFFASEWRFACDWDSLRLESPGAQYVCFNIPRYTAFDFSTGYLLCTLCLQASIDDPDAWRTVTLTDVNDSHTTTTIRRRPRRRQRRQPSNGKMMIMFGLSTAMMIRKLTSFKKQSALQLFKSFFF